MSYFKYFREDIKELVKDALEKEKPNKLITVEDTDNEFSLHHKKLINIIIVYLKAVIVVSFNEDYKKVY